MIGSNTVLTHSQENISIIYLQTLKTSVKLCLRINKDADILNKTHESDGEKAASQLFR